MSIRPSFLFGLILCGLSASGADSLEAGFANPPESARPWAFWTWINGSVSKEGIRADFEDMRRVGIGGVLFFDGSLYLPEGPVRYGSDLWHDHVQFALRTADELGLKVTPMICAGWATSGGPWNGPEHSMKRLVWSETDLTGGSNWNVVLPAPAALSNYYHDIAVVCVPEGAITKIERLPEKTGIKPELSRLNPLDWSREKAGIAPADALDLTSRTHSGKLSWRAPPGKWRILRFGYTTTGARNHPSAPEGEGFEVDKFDERAVERHLGHALGRIVREAGPLAGRSLAGITADSWEAGSQNWTADMPGLFEQRRGYSLIPWLPALAGYVIGSKAETEAFLSDFRRTLGELYGQNYFSVLKRWAQQRGLNFSSEAYGGVFDEHRALAQVDVPMTEFWNHGLFKALDNAPSAAHFWGRKIVMAEAFTSRPPHAQWTEIPFSMKALGDAAFAQGISKIALHSYVHQPRSDITPGFTHGRYGTHFGRLNSWWPLAGGWMDYLSRSSFLLQQGGAVSDLLVITPEQLKSEYREIPEPVVKGFKADRISTAFLAGLSVANNRVVSPGGAEYRLLVLPDEWVAGYDTLRELRRLAKQSAMIIGAPPFSPNGLVDMRNRSEQWKRLVDEIWEGSRPLIDSRIGIEAALKRLRLRPDFAFQGANADLFYMHRKDKNWDIYFISNQSGQPFDPPAAEKEFRYHEPKPLGQKVTCEVEFRVSGRMPEIWDPATGCLSAPAAWQVTSDCTRMRLSLDPSGSIFVVFRKALPSKWPVAVTRESLDVSSVLAPLADKKGSFASFEGGTFEVVFSDRSTNRTALVNPPDDIQISGPWEVLFQPNRGAPPALRLERLVSLSDHPDSGVRYFSGVAVYHTHTTLPYGMPNGAVRAFLDLGEVRDIARVTVNGQPADILWKPPFEIEVGNLLRSGRNDLRIEVANRWVNRLIGDDLLPGDAEYAATGSAAGALVAFPSWWENPDELGRRQRVTFATWKHFNGSSPLLRSGLIGPVRLRFAQTADFLKDSQ